MSGAFTDDASSEQALGSDALRILVVEDEALIVMDMEFIIEDAGHRMVEDVPDVPGLEGLDLGIAPDLALVDLQLARGSSGLDAARYIRDVWPQAVIVFVTANPKMLLPDIAQGDAVVPKPFTRIGLTTALLFLQRGIKNPPPRMALPDGFIPNRALQDRWELT